jgi:hypothetical protein
MVPLARRSSNRHAAALFLLVSVAIVAIQIWTIAVWKQSFDAGHSQEERVAIYLSRLPLLAGQLGSHSFTWLLILIGAVGSGAGYASARLQSGTIGRALSLTVTVTGVVLTLWYLFTLM